jgi:hypothetical protein
MSRFRSIPLMVLAVFALAGVSPGLGQPWEGQPMLSLKFGGGDLAAYVAAVRAAAPAANIVVMPDAEGMPMPPVQLEAVPLGAALRLVEREFQLDERTWAKVELQEIGPWQDAESGADRMVFRISAETNRRGPRDKTQTRVWTIAEILKNDLKPDAVLTAVETAVGLAGAETEPAQIKFHEPTGLLLARGIPEQVDAVGEVINRLREGLDRRDVRALSSVMDPAGVNRLNEAVTRRAGAAAPHAANENEQLPMAIEKLGAELAKMQAEKEELLAQIRDLQAKLQTLQAGPKPPAEPRKP